MTSFDWVALGIVVLSTLFAFARGVIREVIALVAWVCGLVGAIAFAPLVASFLPEIAGHPAVRYVVAFSLILLVAVLLGAAIAWPLARAVRAAGLGFVDRFLGSMFGLARGIVLLLAFVLVAGFTSLPRTAWWQRAAFVPPLVAGVFLLRRHLPAELANRLDYSPERPARKDAPVARQV